MVMDMVITILGTLHGTALGADHIMVIITVIHIMVAAAIIRAVVITLEVVELQPSGSISQEVVRLPQ